MNTKYETYAVDKEFDKLQGMDWIHSVSQTWREIEFGHDDNSFLIRQVIHIAAADTDRTVDTVSTFYMRNSQYHRFGGPAVIQNEGDLHENPLCNFGWSIDGTTYTEHEFNFWMACES